jgi:hypothetical protein
MSPGVLGPKEDQLEVKASGPGEDEWVRDRLGHGRRGIDLVPWTTPPAGLTQKILRAPAECR